jgi:predicted alpha/beta-fold hydrolase
MMSLTTTGAGALTRYLGEDGSNTPAKAAVAISPGYQIPAAWYNLSPVYDRIITYKLKKHFLEPNAELLQSTPELRESYAAAWNMPTIGLFHAVSHAMSEYATEQAYNAGTDPFDAARNIKIPLLALNALDDPVCAAENISKEFFTKDNDHAILATTSFGSHLAFYHRWSAEPWADAVAVQFLQAALRQSELPDTTASEVTLTICSDEPS